MNLYGGLYCRKQVSIPDTGSLLLGEYLFTLQLSYITTVSCNLCL
jgi:hypothetical protein